MVKFYLYLITIYVWISIFLIVVISYFDISIFVNILLPDNNCSSNLNDYLNVHSFLFQSQIFERCQRF